MTSQALMSVGIETAEPTFRLGGRQALLDVEPYYTNGVARRVAVSPEGDRFLFLKEDAGAEESGVSESIVVVENWFEELKRLVPTN